MKKKFEYAEMGSVSSGTMRPEDLIPAFVDTLRFLACANNNKADKKWILEIEKRMNNDRYYETEDCEYDLEELFDLLGAYALPYFYFGSHPGDGADYGFWLLDGFEYNFEGKKVSDLSEVNKEDWNQEILLVNDHGNTTLYSCNECGKLTEIWSVV